MTRDEAVTLIKGRLKKLQTTDYDSAIVLEMQHAQAQILEQNAELPWFLLSEYMSYNTQPGEERIPLPVDPNDTTRVFLREYEEGALFREETDGRLTLLNKSDYDTLVEKYPSSTQGIPVEYCLQGPYFRVRPIPDAVYPLKVKVYLRDSKLTANIENRWLKWAADWLINETIYIMATQYLRDATVAQVARTAADTARIRTMVFDEARKHANYNYQMGDD